jgi:serine/threonine-protein phosphatase PGAM5
VARTQLYLVRHGEQDPAALDGGLSQLGREQPDRIAGGCAQCLSRRSHHSPLARASQTADVVAGHLPQVPRYGCEFVADRRPVPSAGQRGQYPDRWHAWLDGVPHDERDDDATALQAAVAHFGVASETDQHELLITHNFVIGWFVRHMLDVSEWRWIGLNQANCAINIVQWESDQPPTLVSFNDTGHL